jgi:hypothetical protein
MRDQKPRLRKFACWAAIAACWRFRGERHIVHAARVGYRLPNFGQATDAIPI